MILQEYMIFANRYQLEKLLGRGGFSEVWLAKDILTGLEIAIKIYAPGQGMDTDGLRVFSAELSGVFNLNHSHLLKPTHVDTWGGMPYMILPYCSRGSVTKCIGKMPEDEMYKLIHDVASGLECLHQNDIVHQDIKPDNILIDDTGHYVVSDFGISAKARSTLRKSVNSNAISGSGTVAYMAPEQFSAHPAPTKASDIWSFGATLFELIEGDVPFGELGGSKQCAYKAKIPEITANVSEPLKNIIYSMLDEEPWNRPKAEDLKKWSKKPQTIKIPPQGDANVTHKTRSSKKWLWWLLMLVIFVALMIYCFKGCSNSKSFFRENNSIEDIYPDDMCDSIKSEKNSNDINLKKQRQDTNVEGTINVPTLTVNQTEYSVGYQKDMRWVTVTSNCNWKLEHTKSPLFRKISKSETNRVRIYYNDNPDTIARSDYFDIVTEDGSKSVRVTVTQAPKSYLEVSETNITAPAVGGSYIIRFKSNTATEYIYPNSDLFTIQQIDNTLNVKINRNEHNSWREGWIEMATKDKCVKRKIIISQAGISNDSTAYALIRKVWTEENIYENGKKGINIHIKMEIYNMRNKKCQAVVYFEDNLGNALKDKNSSYCDIGGNVICATEFSPKYSTTNYEDFVVFMPYNELHVNETKSLRFAVYIWNINNSSSVFMGRHFFTEFTYNVN